MSLRHSAPSHFPPLCSPPRHTQPIPDCLELKTQRTTASTVNRWRSQVWLPPMRAFPQPRSTGWQISSVPTDRSKPSVEHIDPLLF